MKPIFKRRIPAFLFVTLVLIFLYGLEESITFGIDFSSGLRETSIGFIAGALVRFSLIILADLGLVYFPIDLFLRKPKSRALLVSSLILKGVDQALNFSRGFSEIQAGNSLPWVGLAIGFVISAVFHGTFVFLLLRKRVTLYLKNRLEEEIGSTGKSMEV